MRLTVDDPKHRTFQKFSLKNAQEYLPWEPPALGKQSPLLHGKFSAGRMSLRTRPGVRANRDERPRSENQYTRGILFFSALGYRVPSSITPSPFAACCSVSEGLRGLPT